MIVLHELTVEERPEVARRLAARPPLWLTGDEAAALVRRGPR